jgi:rRNA-processing protein FCF1
MFFEFPIDIEQEISSLIGNYRIIIPKPIFNEIKTLSEIGKEKKKKIAKSSLNLIKKKNYEIIDLNVKKTGDDSLIDYGLKLNGIVVTNDKELRKRLKEKSISTIFLRGKQKLCLE